MPTTLRGFHGALGRGLRHSNVGAAPFSAMIQATDHPHNQTAGAAAEKFRRRTQQRLQLQRCDPAHLMTLGESCSRFTARLLTQHTLHPELVHVRFAEMRTTTPLSRANHRQVP
jgi:hypothetical protein